jgi:peptidyl-prolyl cis-trans isomerase A (cyclophilin A)
MSARFAFALAPLATAALALSAALPAAPPRGPHRAAVAPARPAPCPAAPAGEVGVALVTEAGTITVAIDGAHAPVSAANFLCYVDRHRFDGISFYRAMHLAWGDPPNGLIQAGVQGHPARVLPPIAHEPTTQTGLSHVAGALSMARFAPGTATGDFSILLSDMTGLDADPKAANPDLQAGYAVFGHVVAGMDVARRIWDAPRSPTKGDGFMKGQMLDPPVKLISARRVTLPPPGPLPAPTPAPASQGAH